MIGSEIQAAIRVKNTVEVGPYIVTPVARLAQIRVKLDRHQRFYWVDRYSISMNGDPATIVINFRRTEDGAKLQAILDERD